MSLKDITLGTYVYGESYLHRLDPRIKLGCLVLFMIGMVAGGSWISFVVAGTVMCLAVALSGIGVRYLLKSLVPFRWLILVTFLLNVLFTGGRIVVAGPLPFGGITIEGLTAGSIYSLRLLFLVSAASLLTLTTQPVVLVTGIEKLLEPFERFGLRSHDIALAMVITIRFIPVLIDEAVKIKKSHMARGLRPGRSLTARIRSISLLLIPLITSTVRRAEDLAVAMDCRLYLSDAARTRFHELRTDTADWLALGTAATVCFGMIVL